MQAKGGVYNNYYSAEWNGERGQLGENKAEKGEDAGMYSVKWNGER